METKFTKGEWEYTKNCVDKGFYIQTVDKSHRNSFIGDVGGGLQSKQEIEANAKLIAAAPELLDVICEFDALIQGVYDDPVIHESLFNKMKAVIKKATE